MSGHRIGFKHYFTSEFSYRMHTICLNHRENTALKHVYSEVKCIKNFHSFSCDLIVFMRSSYKLIKSLELL
jgi:hypothetical protein